MTSLMRARLEVELTKQWLMEHPGKATVLPVDAFLAVWRECFGEIEVEKSGSTGCSFLVPCERYRVNELIGPAKYILRGRLLVPPEMVNVEAYPVDEADGSVEETAATVQPQETSAENAGMQAETPATQDRQQARGSSSAPAEQIRALIGADHFKALAAELCGVAPQIIRHRTQQAFASRCYLFSIGDGCGLTTYLKLLAELIDELKLFPLTGGSYTTDSQVEEIVVKPALEGLNEAISDANGGGKSNKLICLDISEWMNKLQSTEFRRFLKTISGMVSQQLFVFRIPYVDVRIRQDVLRALQDVMLVHEVGFPPFLPEQLRQYATVILDEHGFSLTEDGWQVFEEKLVEEKSDGRFFGLKTVKKVVYDLFYRKQLSNTKTPGDELLISGKDIASIVTGWPGSAVSALDQLDQLVGIGPIRERILETLAQIKLALRENRVDRPCLHMRFVGNPGTGKTTVARAMGALFKEQGVLSQGRFFEYSGRDLCGQYIGETAPKTTGICRDAYGSVLFIDEAYSLYRGGNDRDYGREALDTLISEMENHRSDLVVIMAGYPDDMEKLLQGNAGLASRMPYVIDFPNYGRSDLLQIFMSMVEGRFVYEESLTAAVQDYFDSLSDDTLASKEFSNARFVRNLFERTWGKAAIRNQMEPSAPLVLLASDFAKASTEREYIELLSRRSRRIGF